MNNLYKVENIIDREAKNITREYINIIEKEIQQVIYNGNKIENIKLLIHETNENKTIYEIVEKKYDALISVFSIEHKLI